MRTKYNNETQNNEERMQQQTKNKNETDQRKEQYKPRSSLIWEKGHAKTYEIDSNNLIQHNLLLPPISTKFSLIHNLFQKIKLSSIF